jgi:tetratricopeptide (TPR) repeat protein
MVALVGLAGAASGCARPPVTARAMALTRTGHPDQAIALLEARLVEDPGDTRARRLLVRVHASVGDLRAAKAQVKELEARSAAGDPMPYLELGHALELTHRFDEALEAYDEAARVAPLDPAGPREAGLRAARWGEAAVARERLDEAVRRGARDAETYHALGLARLHTGDLTGAEQAYRAALAVDPDAVDDMVGLATVALVRNDFLAALAAYDALRARRPELATAELGRAFALAKLGRRDEAKRAVDRAEALGGPAKNIAKLRELVAR